MARHVITRYSITGLPRMGTMGLGRSFVNGRNTCALARRQDHALGHVSDPTRVTSGVGCQ